MADHAQAMHAAWWLPVDDGPTSQADMGSKMVATRPPSSLGLTRLALPLSLPCHAQSKAQRAVPLPPTSANLMRHHHCAILR